MKKVLIVASVPSMIGQFNMLNIEILQKKGWQVSVACNFKDRTVWDENKSNELCEKLKEKGVLFNQVDFTRDAYMILKHLRAYRQLDELIKKENYEMIHCHTPIVAMIARIVSHQNRVKVIYTAHGFHFFKGASLINWLIYYPVEKFLSRWTDCLITINKEDYWRAKKKFRAKWIDYVPGVGIDVEKFCVPGLVQNIDGISVPYELWRQKKREELNLALDEFVIISVGELNANKNHKVVIEAVAKLKDKKVKYLICGQGELKNELTDLIRRLGVEKQVFLLGFRNDIREILWSGDLFAFPSRREGLPVALMEAMACGIPCVASDIRGNRDLFGKSLKGQLILSDISECWRKSILDCMQNIEKRKMLAKEVSEKMINFSESAVNKKMKRIYSKVLTGNNR